nr:hypothetical protein [Escherichia coli]
MCFFAIDKHLLFIIFNSLFNAVKFPIGQIIRQYQGIHQPAVYALSCKKEASNEQHLQSSLWVMDAYFFQDLPKGNIRVANPTKDDVTRISSL